MDTIEFNPKFPAHSRVILCGSSNTGKSALINRLITFRDESFAAPVDFVLYFYLVKDEKLFHELQGQVDVEFHQGLGNLSDVLERNSKKIKEKGTLVVLEDLQLEAYDSEEVCRLFCAYAHHLPLSAVLMSVQSLYHNARFTSVINRNLTHLVFTRSARLNSVLPHLGRDLFPQSPSLLSKAYETAMDTSLDPECSHPYLICFPDSKDPRTTFYSCIFPDEHLKLFFDKQE